MAREIVIQAGSVKMDAELNDTKAADAIWEALPIEGRGSRWGEEIYFSIPVQCKQEKPQEVVEVGDLAYWPPGSAFCIFFGPTPASSGDEPSAASAVTVFGKVKGDAKEFGKVRSGEKVTVTRKE